jgi:GNAT superfamily N-acetyltransferase
MIFPGMFKFISSLLFSPSRTPLNLLDFKEKRFISAEMEYPNNYFNRDKKECGVWLEYFDSNDKSIAYIRYYINTGQVGLFFMNKEYHNRSLGKQILSKAIEDMRENGCEEMWASTLKDHQFWSNVYNKALKYRDPAHPSVTGDGYYLNLRDKETVDRILAINRPRDPLEPPAETGTAVPSVGAGRHPKLQ